MAAFKPKGSRALRVIIAERAAAEQYGTVLTFAELAAELGAADNEAGRALVRQSVSAARPLLLRDYSKALVAVRGHGYRVAEPGEFAGIAQEHRGRADRSLHRALATVDHAPVEHMTQAERARHNAVSTVLHNVVSRMTAAEKRLADLEAIVYGPPRAASRIVNEDGSVSFAE